MVKKIGLVVAHKGYQPVEYGTTKQILEDNGFNVVTISDQAGAATATDGSTTGVDIVLPEVQLENLAGIFFIGGSDALEHLDNAYSYTLIQEANMSGMPFGAICLSVRILAYADALADKKATGWNGDNLLEGIFQEHGAIYTKQPVVVDKNCITADGPDAALAFGKTIVALVNAHN